ncbi:MAG: hypothetical protein WCK03_00885 [Candidatus Taylorbacteria bacterium]
MAMSKNEGAPDQITDQKVETQVEKNAKITSIEIEVPKSLEEIRRRIDAIQATVHYKDKEEKEAIKTIAKQIVDMTEGNRKLSKSIDEQKDPMHGSGYWKEGEQDRKNIEYLSDESRKISRNHDALVIDIAISREELLKLVDTSSGNENIQYRQLLRDLDKQSLDLEFLYNNEYHKTDNLLNDSIKKHNIEKNRRIGFQIEQEKVAEDPYKFATQEVLKSHGNEIDAKHPGKQSEINYAVNYEQFIRKQKENIEYSIPKFEEYLASSNAALNLYNDALDSISKLVEKNVEDIEKDMHAKVQFEINPRSAIIRKNENPGFFANKNKAEALKSKAIGELHDLKFNIINSINSFIDDRGREIDIAIARLEIGISMNDSSKASGLSNEAMETFLPQYYIDRSIKLTETDPKEFGQYREKLKSIEDHKKQILLRKSDILLFYKHLNENLFRKKDELLKRVDNIFRR